MIHVWREKHWWSRQPGRNRGIEIAQQLLRLPKENKGCRHRTAKYHRKREGKHQDWKSFSLSWTIRDFCWKLLKKSINPEGTDIDVKSIRGIQTGKKNWKEGHVLCSSYRVVNNYFPLGPTSICEIKSLVCLMGNQETEKVIRYSETTSQMRESKWWIICRFWPGLFGVLSLWTHCRGMEGKRSTVCCCVAILVAKALCFLWYLGRILGSCFWFLGILNLKKSTIQIMQANMHMNAIVDELLRQSQLEENSAQETPIGTWFR